MCKLVWKLLATSSGIIFLIEQSIVGFIKPVNNTLHMVSIVTVGFEEFW